MIARRGETTSLVVWQQQYTHNHVWSLNYIMAGRAFVVNKNFFIIETVVFWHCVNNQTIKKRLFWCIFSYVNNYWYSVINFHHAKPRYIEPCDFICMERLLRWFWRKLIMLYWHHTVYMPLLLNRWLNRHLCWRSVTPSSLSNFITWGH